MSREILAVGMKFLVIKISGFRFILAGKLVSHFSMKQVSDPNPFHFYFMEDVELIECDMYKL